ncbi:MAG: hypothetical protein ABSE55_07845 [Terracidiphilus sp.]
MPRIDDAFADCSIYLYASERAARLGEDAGGSGFLIHVPSSVDPNWGRVYAVTNRHVIEEKFCTLRLNRKGGGTDVVETERGKWFIHEDGDDVGIFPIDIGDHFKRWSVGTDKFLDKESLGIYKIGYGDDVFMVGRLISHSGILKNTPVVRFGTISLMADESEPIKYGGRSQEAFLVECRSISGFSGSPVFLMSDRVYRAQDAENVTDLRKRKAGFARREGSIMTTANFKVTMIDGTVGPLLLGIDFGHLPHWDEVHQGKRKTDYRSLSNSGIAGVVPSWKIMDLLDTPALVEERRKGDEELKEKLERDAGSIALNSQQDAGSPELNQ